MVRVVFINRYFFPDQSATSQILTDLAFSLAGRDSVEIHVISGRQLYGDPDARLPAFEEDSGVHIHRVWSTRHGRSNLLGRAIDYLSFHLTSFVKLLQLARAGDVVVAKTDPPMMSVTATLAARIRGAKVINWLQDVFPEVATILPLRGLPGGALKILARLRDYSLRRAASNVVIGQRMKDYLVGRRIDADNIAIVPNWSDGRAIRPLAPESNPLREAWGLTGKLVLGYSGNMGRVHDLQTILDAAELMRGDDRVRFLFVGSGSLRAQAEEFARTHHLRNVMFKPYQPREQLGLSLTVPDVHFVSLLPALEGYVVPSKFCGVAAAGRATVFIGDAAGEIGRLISEHQCGVSVRPGASATIAELAASWAADRAPMQAMGARARALFDERFDQQIALRSWNHIIDAVIDQSSDRQSLPLHGNGGAGNAKSQREAPAGR